MAELVRADEVITAFRLRIGEPREGTFRKVHYDGINRDLDELLFILNEAQRHLTWMCYSANQPLLEATFDLEVISGVSRYTLPADFLAAIAVFYRTYGQEYEVLRENIIEVRRATRSLRSDYRYHFYEVREQVPIIAARGVISEDSMDRIVSTGLASVRVGDTAYNLTDDSQALVKATFPALNAIMIEKLDNGKVNKFQKGDIFQVDMAEQTRDAIEFWPAVDVEDSALGYAGTPTNFMLTEDNVMFRIEANISNAQPSGYEADERITLRLEDGNNNLIAEGSREGLVTGLNEFYFPDFVQLEEDTGYSVRVLRADNGNELPVSKIELFVRATPSSVQIPYAKLPRPMKKRTDYCEVPSWALNGLYAYAHILAQKKMSRNPNPDRGLVAEFEREFENIKSFLYKKDERGPHSYMGGGRRISGSPFPSNYGTAVGSIWDWL